MDRTHTWPDLRDGWILYEDEDLIAVDKPPGIPSQAADPERPDDLVARLKSHLEARGKSTYLGVHQRLDRDTSGVLVFARRREANASLAAQFEGRRVGKTYLACVTGWPAGRKGATLRDVLLPDGDGGVRVARGSARGKEAVTRVEVSSRQGPRAMLSLTLETGRTHQARVQLAHAGAPIAGDTEYGGAAAPRLMLHASVLRVAHPRTAAPMRLEAPAPEDFAEWLARGDLGEAIYDDAGALGRALDRAVERRWALARATEGPRATTAFRLVNEDGDALPKVAVDVYGDWAVVQLHGGQGPWEDAARREALLDRVYALGFDGVYLKVRPKQANVLVDSRREDVAPRAPVRGRPAPDDLVVFEEGLPLRVRLGDGLSTGLFLDQRANRRRVRAMAAGMSVANLFAYTCAFSAAAAFGGARRTVSIDASVAALDRGQANVSSALAHAGMPAGDHAFVAVDAFAWLASAAKQQERFDLLVLDPPSYSTTKHGRFVAETDYGALASSALQLLSPRGRLLACTNHRRIAPHKFRRILFDAARAAGRDVAQVKDLSEEGDFPVAPGAHPHMKSALVSLGSLGSLDSARAGAGRAKR